MNDEERHEGATRERIWQSIKPPLSASSTRRIGMRDRPRFLTVEDYEEEERFTIIIPTARRTWWIVAILGLLALWIVGLPSLGFLSVIDGSYDNRGRWTSPSFSWGLFLFGFAVLIAVTWVVWWWAFPRIRVTADHENIRVHNHIYAWDRAEGFRLGYSLGGVERKDSQGFYAGLRMAYGPWGDDLPFMVRDYYAPAYIMFLNQALQSVQPRAVAISTDSVVDRIVF